MKKIHKIFAGLLFLSLIAYTSCQKKEVVKTIGFVQGFVFDGNTNAPLDSVLVKWYVGGEKDSTSTTAADGYSIDNLPEGEYSVWCSKEGYTTIVDNVYVGGEFSMGGELVRGGANKALSIDFSPNLYPLNGGMKGRVYKQENGIDIPAVGAIVQLDYNNYRKEDDEDFRFVPNIYEATTDADGYFTFTNIPATDLYVYVLDYTDANGETYYDNPNVHTSPSTTYIQSGVTYNYGNIVLTQQTDDIRLINSNLYTSPGVATEEFGLASDITLTFNKDVDQGNSDNLGYATITAGPATVTYSGNVVTINPDSDLTAGTWYTVNYYIFGTKTYDDVSGSITFRTL